MTLRKPLGVSDAMPNKKLMFSLLAIIAAIVVIYVIRRQALLVGVVALISLMILSVPLKDAICIMFMVTPFVNLFNYRQINIYIFIVAACMLKIVLKSRFLKASLFLIVLLGYCILFVNKDVNFRIGSYIEPILLLASLFVCGAASRDVYRPALNCYTLGFIISAFVGLLKNELPAMKRLFDEDFLFVEGLESGETVRYSGLAGDPNYFAAICYVLIAIILFTNKKLKPYQLIAVVTIAIFGLFTYSKSYILTLIVIIVIYILKNSKHVIRNAVLIGFAVIALAVVENVLKTDVLSLVFARFNNVETANDLTTGRTDLWVEYITYIFDDTKRLFLGMGFNATSLDKAAHSTYIEFFYLFGVIGCMLWTAYLTSCISYVSHTIDGQKLRVTTWVPTLVFLVGFMFLSAFHFRELWCLSCLTLFATYMPEEELQECRL